MKPIGWMRVLSLRCRESTELLSRREDAPLTRSERWALSLHLLFCTGCRRFAHQLRQLRGWLQLHTDSDPAAEAGPPALNLGNTRPGVTLSDEARARIESALRNESKE